MKKKAIIIVIFFLTVVGILAVIFKLSGIYDPGNVLLGNNINSYFYTRAIGKESYESLERAMNVVDKGYSKEKLLYKSETGNVAKVFMLAENEVEGYEFLIRDNRYYYIGGRNLVFYGVNQTKEYSWEETVLCDLSCSTKKTYKNIIKIGERYNVLPAWGVSDREQIKDITIDGQEIDTVIDFSQNGKLYYLWIINDLKTENNAANVIIEKR